MLITGELEMNLLSKLKIVGAMNAWPTFVSACVAGNLFSLSCWNQCAKAAAKIKLECFDKKLKEK